MSAARAGDVFAGVQTGAAIEHSTTARGVTDRSGGTSAACGGTSNELLKLRAIDGLPDRSSTRVARTTAGATARQTIRAPASRRIFPITENLSPLVYPTTPSERLRPIPLPWAECEALS